MDSPIVVFLLGALALPGVTSAVTTAIRWVSDNLGIKPTVTVYVASLIVTGAILAMGGGDAVPGWTGSGPESVAAWIAWATVNAELARRLYEALIERLYPVQA